MAVAESVRSLRADLDERLAAIDEELEALAVERELVLATREAIAAGAATPTPRMAAAGIKAITSNMPDALEQITAALGLEPGAADLSLDGAAGEARKPTAVFGDAPRGVGE